MLKAIKIRLYLNKEQIQYTNNLFGCSRFIYNNLLNLKKSTYDLDKTTISFSDLGKRLTSLKDEFVWLKDVHSKVLQQSLIDLNNAYNNFFKHKRGYPKFKSKKDNLHKCRFPVDAINNIKGNRISLIRQLSNIHYKCSRRDEIYLNKYKKHIKSATLSKTKAGIYELSILIDRFDTKQLPQTDNIVGIDLGIKDFVISSDGIKYENIKTIRNNEKKLKQLNRRLSKKTNGSKNKEKCRIKLAKFNRKIKNIKEYYLHTIANKLLNENQIIAMEDLNIVGMMQNHKLAKSIQELSLGRFKEILKYKAEWFNREIVEIGRYYPSSKTCSVCNFKNKELTLKDREWVCDNCGTEHDRDDNASKNIKKEGIRILSEMDN
jgi:putative transposase